MNIKIDQLGNYQVAVQEIKKFYNLIVKAQNALYTLANSKENVDQNSIKCGTVLIFALLQKISEGKNPTDFTHEDWEDIAEQVIDTGILLDDALYTEYIFDMYSRFIQASVIIIQDSVNSITIDRILACIDELQLKKEALHDGCIKETQYIEDCLWICLDAMMKLISVSVSSYAARFIGPEATELAVSASSFALETIRLKYYQEEQQILSEYLANQYVLDKALQDRLDSYQAEIEAESIELQKLIENAFHSDFRASLQHSVAFAKNAGVDDASILKNIDDIDSFFLE